MFLKRILPFLLFMPGLITACMSPEENVSLPEVSRELISIEKKDSTCTAENCTYISLTYPKFLGEDSVVKTANGLINHELGIVLGTEDEDSGSMKDLEVEAEAFITQYIRFKQEFPEISQPWMIESSPSLFFQNDTLFSFGQTIYYYTGGAHANQYEVIYTIRKKNGRIITPQMINASFDGLSDIAEEYFRKERRIPPGESLVSAGFNFINGEFSLPQNLGYGLDGLVFRYNPYEVSAFAAGPTHFVVPYNVLIPEPSSSTD